MSQIDIILASYNGEKFISQQIDSIIGQDFCDWLLLVSDDGSTDSTLSILQNYESKDKRIKIINTERQGSSLMNFRKGLDFSTSSFIMFADQDDIWPSNRISSMYYQINNLQNNFGSDVPILIYSDLKMINENNNIIANSYYKVNKYNPYNNYDIKYAIWKCTAAGCASIFNKSLLIKSKPIPIDISMHDHWMLLVALCFGRVHYLDEQTILYRQHDNNVVGGKQKNALFKIVNIRRYMNTIKKSANYSILHFTYIGEKTNWIFFKNLNLNTFLGKLTFLRIFYINYFFDNIIFSLLFCFYILRSKK